METFASDWRNTKRRPTSQCCIVLLATTIFLSVGLFLFPPAYEVPLRVFSDSGSKASPQQSEAEFYQWQTVTYFKNVNSSAADYTTEQLCQHFPMAKLSEVQPVLKTGHGVIERARQSLSSTSACLDNLLVFSDLSEDLEQYHVIDVIADMPEDLLRSDGQTLPYFEMQKQAMDGTLDGPGMSKGEGWRTDKFKFLPAISRAWRAAPEKSWYVFYEGDTYIVWDTVFRLLEHFDADVPHYLGSPSPGADHGGGLITWFANGGPGYILSRGAMRKLVKHDLDRKTGKWRGSKLAERNWNETLTNCCGDSSLGSALWNEDIELKGLWPLFCPHPLHGVPFSDLYWCQPVLSMHKTEHEDALKLSQFEWDHRDANRPLLYRDLAVGFLNMTDLTRRRDWDNADWDSYRPSPDDQNEPDESPDNCERACAKVEDSDCFQWTYHLQRCKFVRSFRMGGAKAPKVEDGREDHEWSYEDQRYVAGWNSDLIKRWISERPCDEVQWVKPSIERIF
ncbi:glycosyltransferase family 31 protein [Dothistroma septosporum NZE10]|uniref:N-acetylgalactosaminide beta-1,3-galactosyltransferase n=1 Tax=Dothistroma septosporum (strain NZE10 / CBS 128990) TaxID=675120 RepID=N1PCD3_DOTSN|nr:glycosyltransferase family 31 protein [Dothistroma septosporum NZE10]